MGILWEFSEHSLASFIVALIVFPMNRSLFVRPYLEWFRKTVDSHSSQFALAGQMFMIGKYIVDQVAEQIVAILGNKPAVH